MNTTVKLDVMVKVNGKELKLGESTNSSLPGTDIQFDIKQRQDVSETVEAIIVGFQYVEFSEFLMLIEVLDHIEGDSNLFLFDSNKIYTIEIVERDKIQLELFEGTYADFHKLVGTRL